MPVIFGADLAILVDPVGAVQRGEGDIVTMNSAGDVIGPSFEREALFDFKGGQLSQQLGGGGTAPAGIRVYNSPFGNAKFDLAYRYRNAAFYDLLDLPGDPPSLPISNRSRDAFYVNTDGGQVFLNPNTFQLSTLGLDGRPSQFELPDGSLMLFAASAINRPSMGTAAQRAGWQQFSGDNIANFAAGRVDAFDFTEAVELGNRNPE